MDITSFHIAARCVCIDKTSFVIKKRWAGDPPSKGSGLLQNKSDFVMPVAKNMVMHA